MIEDDINSHRCRFCKSSFSVEILKKIKDDKNDVYCENCGDLIKRVQNKYNFNPTEIIEKTSNTNTNDTPTKPQKDLESNPDALHYPIGRIFYDKEFPLIFKSNFIIVFSRLTYFHALYLDSKGQIELGGKEVPENAINNLFMSIRHIQNKRIKSEFLNNLHEISKEEFERNLKQLQSKIQSNREYREDFIVYSRWLISKVYLIISMKWNDDNLNKFDRIIRDDLKSLEIIKIDRPKTSVNRDDLNRNEEPFIITNNSGLNNSFRRDLYNKVRNVVYTSIVKNGYSHKDFNSEDHIIKIIKKLKIPSTFEEIDNSSNKNKKDAKRSLKNKIIYISILGKIMNDVLDFNNNDNIADISRRYNVSRDFVTKTAKFLSNKHEFQLEDRFPTTSARGSGSPPSRKVLNEVKKISVNFKDAEILTEIATEIFEDLITGSNKLIVDNLPQGYKTDPKYLAISIIYYGLRHIRYINRHANFKSYGILKFINDNFPDDTTMKLAISNTVPGVYNFISDKLKSKILYHPQKKLPRENYNKINFLKELEKVKEEYKNSNRSDNVFLIDLIISTLKHYKSENFQQYVSDMLFWDSYNKAWRLLEKLSTPETLRRISDLEDFVIGYTKLINNLDIKNPEKKILLKFLENFEEERDIYYNYENSHKEKRKREYERYLSYGDNFFSHSSRIKRFLLMLGFSPYDGFDLWDNKIAVNGKHKIYANFHHYHYDPEEQSENDLVFVPIKPSKKIRTKIFENQQFLTHNMISGREGLLKKPNISPKAKNQLRHELKEIEEIIEYNSKIIEDSIYFLRPDLLNNLKNWSKESIKKAKLRILDSNFSWAKGIEESIPLTKEYTNKKIDQNETKRVIQEILNERERRILD